MGATAGEGIITVLFGVISGWTMGWRHRVKAVEWLCSDSAHLSTTPGRECLVGIGWERVGMGDGAWA